MQCVYALEGTTQDVLKRLESNGNTVGRLMAEYNERGGAVAYRHDGQSPGTGASPREAHGASGTLRTIEVDAQVDPRWEAFVVAQPHGLIYHHPAWLQVLEEAYGCKPVSLACEDADGQLVGILPLFHTRGLFTGCRLSSLPHTPLAGPLARDVQAMAALVRAAVEQVCGERGARLQLKVSS